jgi:hypothetical protein
MPESCDNDAIPKDARSYRLACKCKAPKQVIKPLLDGNASALVFINKHGMLPMNLGYLYSSLSLVQLLMKQNPQSIGA